MSATEESRSQAGRGWTSSECVSILKEREEKKRIEAEVKEKRKIERERKKKEKRWRSARRKKEPGKLRKGVRD